MWCNESLHSSFTRFLVILSHPFFQGNVKILPGPLSPALQHCSHIGISSPHCNYCPFRATKYSVSCQEEEKDFLNQGKPDVPPITSPAPSSAQMSRKASEPPPTLGWELKSLSGLCWGWARPPSLALGQIRKGDSPRPRGMVLDKREHVSVCYTDVYCCLPFLNLFWSFCCCWDAGAGLVLEFGDLATSEISCQDVLSTTTSLSSCSACRRLPVWCHSDKSPTSYLSRCHI